MDYVEVVFVLQAIIPQKISTALYRAVMGSGALLGVTATVASHFDTFDRTAVVSININVVGKSSQPFAMNYPAVLRDYAAQQLFRASEGFTNA